MTPEIIVIIVMLYEVIDHQQTDGTSDCNERTLSCDTTSLRRHCYYKNILVNKYWKDLRGHGKKYTYFAIYVFHRNIEYFPRQLRERELHARTW